MPNRTHTPRRTEPATRAGCERAPLLIETRRLLWDQLWTLLLAPPAADGSHPSDHQGGTTINHGPDTDDQAAA